MKKKFVLMLALVTVLSCLLVISVSAEVTTYDDAPARTKIQISTDDIIEFYDGFTCPSAYVFKDVSTIGSGKYNKESFSSHMDFEYINGKTGKTYTFADVKGFDIPEGVTTIKIYAGASLTTVKWISIPATAVNLDNAIFQGASGLEECIFEHGEDSTLTKFPAYTFFGCSSLKAFSMPDSITTIPGIAHFTKCSSLEAVYLSKNLEKWESGGGGSYVGTFDLCNKLYFVNEPFGKGEVPAKPTVYYFPKNLETIAESGSDFSNNSTIRDCYAMNEVLVFGTKVTSITNEYLFQGGAERVVVFLGDMEHVAIEWWGVKSVIFANPADVDASSLTFKAYVRNTGRTCHAYFCSTGNKYALNKKTIDEIVASLETNSYFHVKEKTLLTEANCENPKMVADYCFCGSIMGEPQTEGVALGHKYEGAVSYEFTSLITQGAKYTVCTNNCGKPKVEEVGAVYTALGYSAKTFGKYSFVSGYDVNTESLAIYEKTKGVTLSFGFAFNTASTFTDGEVTLDSFKIVAPVTGASGNTAFSFYQYAISYETEENLDTDIVIAAYVIEKSENGETLTFINRADGEVNGFAPINYNKAFELVR